MNKKRIVTAVTCCALVGAIAVGGTIALLTSNAHTLKNTFTIGNNYPENALTLKEHAVERVTDLNATNHTGYTFGDYAQTNSYTEAATGQGPPVYTCAGISKFLDHCLCGWNPRS